MLIIRFQPPDVSSPIDDLSPKNITYLEPNSVKWTLVWAGGAMYLS